MKKLKIIELFSGIGAQSKALKNMGINYKIVATSDWDIFANISYACIHYNEELISKIKEWESIYEVINLKERKRERERKKERERERETWNFSF